MWVRNGRFVKKMPVEELMNRAEEWFESLPFSVRIDIMLQEYMKAEGIRKNEVEW